MNITKKKFAIDQEDNFLKDIQKFLKKTPVVIIWGSGATIPYGLPSMSDLKQCLKSELGELKEETNLETELGKIHEQSKIDKLKELIRKEILKKDLKCLNKSIEDDNYLKEIEIMIKIFYKAHPQKIDIITTNYDQVLEYALSKLNYNFTDGFKGRALTKFNPKLFGKKEIINLIKVHGSLNWFFDKNKEVFCLPPENKINNLKCAMVLPAEKNKYHETFQEPYRTLINQSDRVIEKAKSFLVIGFGFNDEHLTPKIDNKIKKDTPIVIITKKATDSCKEKLKNANKYCLLEENKENRTKVTIKTKKNTEEKVFHLQKQYWQIKYFMEVL
ncbi:MAG: SIR2 family protein [Bdellovibrionales bacterium]|nr:SIR2 family protein [Bdellovibrionales bacterium]